MKLSETHIRRLEAFFTKIGETAYPERSTKLHTDLSNKMFEYFIGKYPLRANSKILDVGCGQGVAQDIFQRQGHRPVGITLNEEDFSECREKGYNVYRMDQSFLDFQDQEFDFIWCRHCLEHSIMPFFTLSELYRVLRPQGYLYIEVPAPDTPCKHQTNKNHYSLFSKSMWAELIMRSGFKILEVIDVTFEVAPGTDVYYSFIQQKP